ncbi:xanthine dehydrogenase family protein molybdopterin-binding subunit [Nocardioides hwasunensis]|uniref:Xanthine dehydrogenase family protein n=1 Tax=Nocardioides hwasunensis TaxID=397258 RepID=A0ABR8MKW5_9ACTN|nr:xanthine dehydrogenase family protein molybdopterin-binding subunit [Nocardioides hwasunensis]MBD3915412.1 xanthine dehydrogenase family protein [Nocardioides hwasunensis]
MTSAPVQEGRIGASPRKRDGATLLTGRALFLDDYAPTGLLHAVVVRSTVAHGRILTIDTAAAEGSDGVVLVLTGEQAAQHAGPVPYFIDPAARGGNRTDIRCLQVDKVVHHGQPVAAVVAGTRLQAEAAARLVEVEYDVLPHVLDATAAMAPDAPRIYEDWPGNVITHNRYGSGDADSRLAESDVVVSGELHIGRTTTSPIEPRGYLASWADDRLTVHASCQNPHQMRWMLSVSLGIDESRIRIVTAKVGGSFGLKMQGHPEETLIALLSILTGRPVKWIEDRRETLMAGAREQVHRFRVGARRDGRILGLVNEITADVGALTAQAGWAMPNMSATTQPSGYAVQDCRIELDIVCTNKPPLNAARGFGKDAAHFVMERAVDLVARELDLDPADVRRINFIPTDEFPYRTSTGLNIDSGDFHGLLDKVLDAVDYPALRERQQAARAEGRCLGIGLGFELTPESSDSPGTFVSGFDTTTVRMSVTGSVTVLTGVTSPGGGNDTGLAQIVSDEIGIPIDWVELVQGDTDRCPNGFGNFSGRSMVVGGGSATLAARDVRDKLVDAARRLMGLGEGDEVTIGDGVVSAGGTSMAVPDVARGLLTRAFAIGDIEPVLESTRAYKPGNINHVPDELGRIQPYPTYSSSLHAAVVDVDPETGKVTLLDYVMAHDCGTMINPALVEGQARGAVTMGLGSALSEQLRFAQDGSLASNRFKSYLLPRAGDVPLLRMLHQVTPSPFTMHGNKGAGEAGVGGAQASVANAVEDALASYGVTVDRVPLNPPAVLDLMDAAMAASDGGAR